MRLANRIAHITGGGDDGWEIYYRTRALEQAGEAVINLTIGEHDVKTDRVIATPSPKGLDRLKERLDAVMQPLPS